MGNSIFVLQPTGAWQTREMVRGLDLAELQRIVGGYIETVRVTWATDILCIVDEEGRLKDLPFNLVASSLCSRTIVGTAVFARSGLNSDGEPDIMPLDTARAMWLAEMIADILNETRRLSTAFTTEEAGG